MFRKQKKEVRLKGFSMIEALFGIFILGMIVLFIFFPSMVALFKTHQRTREILIATNLAQEGIEMVRAYRDFNIRHMPPDQIGAFNRHTEFFTLQPTVPDPRSFFITSNATGTWGDPNDCEAPLSTPTANCLAKVSPDFASRFGRSISVTKIPDSEKFTNNMYNRYVDVQVVVTVKMNGYQVILNDRLYNWGDYE